MWSQIYRVTSWGGWAAISHVFSFVVGTIFVIFAVFPEVLVSCPGEAAVLSHESRLLVALVAVMGVLASPSRALFRWISVRRLVAAWIKELDVRSNIAVRQRFIQDPALIEHDSSFNKVSAGLLPEDRAFLLKLVIQRFERREK